MESRKYEHAFGSEATNGCSHALSPSFAPHARSTSARSPARAAIGRDRHGAQLQRLLAAAADVFAREGYERASMRQIARAAGMSLAGLYHYVEHKQHLLFLIQFRAFSSLLMEIQSRLAGVEGGGGNTGDPAQQLRALIRTHVAYVARSMATLKVCSHELDALKGEPYEQVWRVRREYYELARSVVARLSVQLHSAAPASPTVAPGSGLDARVATMSLFGTLNWLYRWYDPQRDCSPATLANQIYAQFVAGLAGAGSHLRRTPALTPRPTPGRRDATVTSPRTRSAIPKEAPRAPARNRAARAR